MAHPKQTTFIALLFESGAMGRMQYYAEPTVENVDRECARAVFDAELGAITRWMIVGPEWFTEQGERENWKSDYPVA